MLADGTQKAAERIGKGAEKYAVAIRGKSLAYHDPRMSPSLGTANIADANPAHHMDSQITGMLSEGAPIGSDPALQASKQNPFAGYAIGSAYHQLLNAAGLCSLYTVATTPPPLAELIAGASGWDFGWEEASEGRPPHSDAEAGIQCPRRLDPGSVRAAQANRVDRQSRLWGSEKRIL